MSRSPILKGEDSRNPLTLWLLLGHLFNTKDEAQLRKGVSNHHFSLCYISEAKAQAKGQE